MEFRDYYEILDIPKDASQDEIRKKFRKLARKYHPDVTKVKEGSETKFKEINEAYEVLGDPEKRKKYDALGPNWNQASAPHSEDSYYGASRSDDYEYQFKGTGFSDFFEQMFGAGARSGGGSYSRFTSDPNHGQRAATASQDAYADILVSLEEVMNGAERTLQLKQINRATGQIEIKSTRIRIPKGISEGQLVRCAGLGSPGINGGSPGDLFLNVKLEKPPYFQAIDSDLYYHLSLAPWEAVLGAEVTVKSLESPVKIKIPPLTENGTELRIKNKGLPSGSSGSHGDLYAVIHIATPTQTSEQENDQWRKLAEVSSFNPRNPEN